MIEYVIPGDIQANKRNNTIQKYDEHTQSGNDGKHDVWSKSDNCKILTHVCREWCYVVPLSGDGTCIVYFGYKNVENLP